jgi:hypothetical protein
VSFVCSLALLRETEARSSEEGHGAQCCDECSNFPDRFRDGHKNPDQLCEPLPDRIRLSRRGQVGRELLHRRGKFVEILGILLNMVMICSTVTFLETKTTVPINQDT